MKGEIKRSPSKIKPHLRYIPKFKLRRLISPVDITIDEYAKNGNYNFDDVNENSNKYYINDYVAKFPVIIQEDGKIWELANVYLVSCMLASSELTGSTLKSIAMDLLDYYKFVSERNLDLFYFPTLNRHRVSYQYRNYLLNKIYEGKCHRSTASRRINRIVDFYDSLLTNGFISSENFANEPFERIIKKITLNNSIGREFQKVIRSSNIAINNPKKNKQYDLIKDSGNLRPLTIDQQKIFLEYLKNYSNRQTQLICVISLLTGARLQTICTLRVHHIKSLMKGIKKENNKLYVGGKTGVDTKGNKDLYLIFPTRLIYIIDNYINSQAWRERARKNYYGTTDQGYVFTTKTGLPYYTSISEIIDIRNDTGRKQQTIRRGEAVRKNLDELISKIRKDIIDYTSFNFHDLRATFGMNYLRFLLRRNFNKDQCLLKLKEVMGHNNVETTLGYLDYKDVTDQFCEAQEKLESDLFGDILNELD